MIAQYGLLKMTLATIVLALLSQGLGAASIEEREATVKENPLKDAYFGETHLHTSY